MTKGSDTPENVRPFGARGTVRRYKLDGTTYARDERGNRWYWHSDKRWVKQRTASVSLYNRFRASASGRGSVRAASFRAKQGSAASYADGSRPRAAHAVKASAVREITYASGAKRSYRANMAAAAAADGVVTDSATVYATAKGAPAVTGGYNWCHLIGHGGGGSDTADNIVAASTHANSEQLEIERILYKFKKKGIRAQVTATLLGGSAHVAQSLTFKVYYNDTVIFERNIDGFRSDKPTFVELAAVEVLLSTAIAEAAGD